MPRCKASETGDPPEGMRVTQPIGFAQDREPVERPVERQMGVFRQPQQNPHCRRIYKVPKSSG